MDTVVCLKCATPRLAPGDRFCRRCAAAFDLQAPASASPLGDSAEATGRISPRLRWGLWLATVLAGLAVLMDVGITYRLAFASGGDFFGLAFGLALAATAFTTVRAAVRMMPGASIDEMWWVRGPLLGLTLAAALDVPVGYGQFGTGSLDGRGALADVAAAVLGAVALVGIARNAPWARRVARWAMNGFTIALAAYPLVRLVLGQAAETQSTFLGTALTTIVAGQLAWWLLAPKSGISGRLVDREDRQDVPGSKETHR